MSFGVCREDGASVRTREIGEISRYRCKWPFLAPAHLYTPRSMVRIARSSELRPAYARLGSQAIYAFSPVGRTTIRNVYVHKDSILTNTRKGLTSGSERA